jgi:hypothetical protein
MRTGYRGGRQLQFHGIGAGGYIFSELELLQLLQLRCDARLHLLLIPVLDETV